MRPVEWFFLLLIGTIIIAAGIYGVPLSATYLSNAGYSQGEVFAGLAAFWMLLMMAVAIFRVRA